MDQISTEQKISKDMTIGDFVQEYPSLVDTLTAEGVHCVGCGAAFHETIEQGLAGHGKTDEEINKFINKINEAAQKEITQKEVENSAEEIPDEIIITEKSAEKVKEFMKGSDKDIIGLRIGVSAGGCSGQKYELAFEKEQKDFDKIIVVNGVKFLIDENSYKILRGSKVDYVETLQESGFKISNPNAKSTCGCGDSFN